MARWWQIYKSNSQQTNEIKSYLYIIFLFLNRNYKNSQQTDFFMCMNIFILIVYSHSMGFIKMNKTVTGIVPLIVLRKADRFKL